MFNFSQLTAKSLNRSLLAKYISICLKALKQIFSVISKNEDLHYCMATGQIASADSRDWRVRVREAYMHMEMSVCTSAKAQSDLQTRPHPAEATAIDTTPLISVSKSHHQAPQRKYCNLQP